VRERESSPAAVDERRLGHWQNVDALLTGSTLMLTSCSLGRRRCVHAPCAPFEFDLLLPTLPPFLHPFHPLPTGPQSHNPPVRLATDPHIHPSQIPSSLSLSLSSVLAPQVCAPSLTQPCLALPCPSSRRKQPVPAGHQLHLPCGSRGPHTQEARKQASRVGLPLYTPRAAEQ
jgi:hypothetical protein